MSEEQCNFEWPMTEREAEEAGTYACPHACRLRPGHDGDHRCCQGQARHPNAEATS